MSALSAAKQEDGGASAESKGSSAPLLKKTEPEAADAGESVESKPRKRDFWRLGKSKDDDKSKGKGKSPTSSPQPTAASPVPPIGGLRPASPLRSAESLGATTSPHRAFPYGTPGSPGQLAGASPRPHSPASSMIFERNVQDEAVPQEISDQIPSHVITENHIPPALDASADAIADSKLNPDNVEIVTHATHQPASVTITGTEHSLSSSMNADDSSFPMASHILRKHETDNASNYGSLDSADVRRLSFVSFADVVHAEQEQGDQRRDSAHLSGGHPPLGVPRSPSPIRSPISSPAYGTSPPTSVSTSAGKGPETSPHRGLMGAGSPSLGASSPLAPEYNVETMRQALRRTGSGDLSGGRSAPLSAVGDVPSERPF